MSSQAELQQAVEAGARCLLLLAPAAAQAPPPEVGAALPDYQPLDLTASLLAHLRGAAALARDGEEAAAQRSERGGRLLHQAAQEATRAALAEALERLLASLKPESKLLVEQPQLALAAGLDLGRLGDHVQAVAWWVPGERGSRHPLLYGSQPAPAALSAGRVVEWRHDPE